MIDLKKLEEPAEAPFADAAKAEQELDRMITAHAELAQNYKKQVKDYLLKIARGGMAWYSPKVPKNMVGYYTAHTLFHAMLVELKAELQAEEKPKRKRKKP